MNLFTEADIEAYARMGSPSMDQRVHHLGDDRLAFESTDALIDSISSEFLIDDVRIYPERADTPAPGELTKLESPGDPTSGRPIYDWVRIVPFTGNSHLFRLRSDLTDPDPPLWGSIDSLGGTVNLFVESEVDADPQLVRTELLARVDALSMHLEKVRTIVAEINQGIRKELAGRIEARAEEVRRKRALHEAVGLSLPKSVDAVDFSIPTHTKAVQLNEMSYASEREYYLARDDYELALQALEQMSLAFERSPSLSAQQTENNIRDILLIGLNARFHGAATGETFNNKGKSDILIRKDGHNVFIGECKKWRGPKSVVDALDQLLGYVSWSDTKAALIVMMKGGRMTDLIAKSAASVETHRNCVREVRRVSVKRHEYLFHAEGDPKRRVQLAVIYIPISAA